jgi:hypothetical protein
MISAHHGQSRPRRLAQQRRSCTRATLSESIGDQWRPQPAAAPALDLGHCTSSYTHIKCTVYTRSVRPDDAGSLAALWLGEGEGVVTPMLCPPPACSPWVANGSVPSRPAFTPANKQDSAPSHAARSGLHRVSRLAACRSQQARQRPHANTLLPLCAHGCHLLAQ